MESEWRDLRWGDLASLEYGRGLRGHGTSKGIFCVFGTNGPIGWHDEALCPHPGVIIGRKGAYRGVHYSPSPFFVIDTAFYLEAKTEIDLRWAYYELLTQDINGMDSGSAIPSTSREAFYALPVRVPPLAQQRAIAHILGTQDDKIELNRRMNETLEAIARSIFKSWFVDFDPVIDNALRAGNLIPSAFAEKAARRREMIACDKAEGRDRGLPKHIACLFPDRFEDTEQGAIPRGWGAVYLSEIIDVNPSRALRKGDKAPYLDMANMPTQGHTPDALIDRAFSSGMRFINGDTLIARITPCLENGKTAYVDFLVDGQVGWGFTEYIVLHPKLPFPGEFGYCIARSPEFREFAIQSMTGTSGRQRVPPDALLDYLLCVPPDPIAFQFGKIVQPLFAKGRQLVKESRILAALRHALLPKLISGQLRVKDAERFMGNAV